MPHRYAPYAVAVLLLAYVVAFVDRQILNLLVEPIRRDTGLTDVEISLLQGLSFAIFVSVGGLPIGRLVDTRRRTALLAIGVAGWSLCTGAFGLAGSFAGMLLARIGVGVGEATMTPSAYSLIGDYVSDRRLGLATAIYGLGPFAGSGLALLLGAAMLRLLPVDSFVVPVMGSIHSWQMIFVFLVPVGLLVAIWVASLREPPRRHATPEPPDRAEIKRYFELPPSGWSIDYDSLDQGRDEECLRRSTSRRRSSASCVRLRSFWARAERLPRHVGASQSASRPITAGARNMAA